jgi:hypothetical protein
LEDHLPCLCQRNRLKENHLKRYTIGANDNAIVTILLAGISAAHLLRLIFHEDTICHI